MTRHLEVRRQRSLRRRLRLRSLTVREIEQLRIVNGALDAGTEFGLEMASRERLLIRVGEMTQALRLLKETIG